MKYNISLGPDFKNAGVFTFIQTKPEKVTLAQVEVFTVKVRPFHSLEVDEGSDVTMSCEVSRLPDSATLDWERDREPTANTTLIFNQTAHITIHSTDLHSAGKNQSVVLNCEISQVIGSVTLAWLWMRGGRGELVKQEVLREGHPNRILNLTLLGLSEDQPHWACVVFTESMLRAQVPLNLTTLVTEPQEKKTGWSTETVVRVVIVVVATLGMLKVLLWYYKRRPQTKDTSTGTQQPMQPLRSARVNEGPDVTMSCEVSRLPDSATLDWERDREPTANITLIINQTAHITIHSTDRHSAGKNQAVVLNCEISQVIGSVTLAWLWMRGGRGELVKQEVLREGHPNRILNLTLLGLSEEQLHWACVVFTESMLRAQVPLHLTLPTTAITEPQDKETAQGIGAADTVHSNVADVQEDQVLVQYKYILSGQRESISLQAPTDTNGTEFIWEWTSHDGSYINTRIITIQSNGNHVFNLREVGRVGKYDIALLPNFTNAGVFTFIQTKPEKVNLAQVEVFAVKVQTHRSARFNEGPDVTMSCEVSHLPDSATLDWERDREPTANTTLIINQTAHIIIHSTDLHSEGTYSCTLRWNGALIFSVPKTLKVSRGTFGTHPTLYRGSFNSSEVVLICNSRDSYSKAYWFRVPLLSPDAILVTSAEKNKTGLISMEIDRERFSFEVYDGVNFPLRISPLKFGDCGRYICYSEHNVMASITLVTIQVSTVPPGGPYRNQPAVLNCEISQVIGSVTLAWLWMRGGRGELVKQEVLREGHPNRMLSLTLLGLSEDQLHWACVVFTESMLRAQVPLHLTLPTTPITEPQETGWSTETVVRVVIVVVATLGMLKVLLWYYRRRPQTEDTSTGTQQPSTQHLSVLNEDRGPWY
ncbi:hypothetical protein SKAU_G00426870 [Synaphobranchus kaupii]|uniref:Ig-like domain-containing protein n=1 Tax=Synaphobranchus kaupii TaxID=118154 RepID=A0A9Q1E4Y3_SYNKA|nr:hypothetical protein SKAU_G00426870 [Synaphobranchus kaupii]